MFCEYDLLTSKSLLFGYQGMFVLMRCAVVLLAEVEGESAKGMGGRWAGSGGAKKDEQGWMGAGVGCT